MGPREDSYPDWHMEFTVAYSTLEHTGALPGLTKVLSASHWLQSGVLNMGPIVACRLQSTVNVVHAWGISMSLTLPSNRIWGGSRMTRIESRNGEYRKEQI